MIDKKFLQLSKTTKQLWTGEINHCFLVVSMKSRNQDVTHLELSSPWHRPLHGSVPSLFWLLSVALPQTAKCLNQYFRPECRVHWVWLARREPSDKTMMTDNLEGHRSLGCTYLSTIYRLPDNIFISFAKQSCRCARHQTSHCAPRVNDLRGGELKVRYRRRMKSCEQLWLGRGTVRRKTPISWFLSSCHVSVSKQLQRMTIILK